jgi:hypothetical protein
MIFEKATWGVSGKLLGREDMRRAMGVKALKKSYMLEFDCSPFFVIFGHF